MTHLRNAYLTLIYPAQAIYEAVRIKSNLDPIMRKQMENSESEQIGTLFTGPSG